MSDMVLNFPAFIRASSCSLSFWFIRIPILVFILFSPFFGSTVLNRSVRHINSCRERKMSHNDIIEILNNEHSLSASKLYQKLKEKGYTKSLRTLQRQLAKLEHEGIIEAHAIGREIIYSLANTQKSQSILSFLIVKYWNALFEIRNSETPGEAYHKLRSLVLLMPDEIKEQILPLIRNLDERVVLSDEYLGFKYVSQLVMFRREFEAIVDKLASLLHSYTQKVGEKGE